MSRDMEPEDYAFCRLDLTVEVASRFGEPSEYVLQYSGRVISGQELSAPVGEISFYVADLERVYYSGYSPWDVLDSVDSELAHFCSLISVATRRFKSSIINFAGVDICRTLLLGHLEIEPKYRGVGLGLKAIEIVCDRFGTGGGCLLAALKAFPTQWEGKGERSADFRRDRAKLMSYYRQAGFNSVLDHRLMARRLID